MDHQAGNVESVKWNVESAKWNGLVWHGSALGPLRRYKGLDPPFCFEAKLQPLYVIV
jgi:hypothetical protein